MKTLTFALIVLAAGCGQNPVKPSPLQPQVRLSMLVMGSVRQAPIQGAPVMLVHATGRGDVARTDAEGRASWLVESGRSYAISVCGMSGPPSLVTMDAGWLMSLPESYCEGK